MELRYRYLLDMICFHVLQRQMCVIIDTPIYYPDRIHSARCQPPKLKIEILPDVIEQPSRSIFPYTC